MKLFCIPMFLAAILLTSSLLPATPAQAIDDRGNFVPRFNYSCEQLNTFYKNAGLEKDGEGVVFNRSFSVIIGWIAGYVSRVNQTENGKADYYGNLADEAMWIAEWCRLNPASDLAEGMDALTRERTKKPDPKPAAKKAPVGAKKPAPKSVVPKK